MTYEASMGGSRTITAFFDSRSDAEDAIERLVNAGIARSSIRLVPGNESGAISAAGTSDPANEGGFWDTLKDLFMPEDDRYTYAEGLRRGGYLVTLTTDEALYDSALDILDDEGTIDIGERESMWRSEGWSGYTGSSSMGSADTASLAGDSSSMSDASYADRTSARSGVAGSEEVIPVAEEQLRVGKRDVSHGRVRVRSYVVETPVSEQVSLREENVRVERRPVDRAVTGDDRLFQDRTIEVEERAEEAVVAKDVRVREELVINKEVQDRTQTVSDTVRRTEVEVEDERGQHIQSGTEAVERELDRDASRRKR